MLHALVHFPDIDTSDIDRLRQKYDPHVMLIRPHITFVFPVPDSAISEERLADHIVSVLGGWRPFPIRLTGLRKSWDHWLFLVLEEGNEQAMRLHADLYTGPLSPHLRMDLGFIPHIGLGLFIRAGAGYDALNPQLAALDAERYAQALKEAEQMRLDYRCVIDKLYLLKIRDDLSQIVCGKEFPLK